MDGRSRISQQFSSDRSRNFGGNLSENWWMKLHSQDISARWKVVGISASDASLVKQMNCPSTE